MIRINSPEDIVAIRKASAIVAETLDMIGRHIQEGVSTERLNKICHDFIVSKGAVPAAFGYNHFTKSITTSINHISGHGVPREYDEWDGDVCLVGILRDGDTLNVDVAVIFEGHYGDSSRMYCVGKPSPEHRFLNDAAKLCLVAGIKAVKDGAYFSDIGAAIQKKVREINKFSPYPPITIIKDTFGHGVGKKFHDAPIIPHYKNKMDCKMQAGMVFTIEPCICAGKPETVLTYDGWTKATKDGSRTAQWEHTILVTEDGYEILTKSAK